MFRPREAKIPNQITQARATYTLAEEKDNLLQQLAAGVVAAGVCDGVEVVESDVTERVMDAKLACGGDGFLEPLFDFTAVARGGQRIVLRRAGTQMRRATHTPVGIAHRWGGIVDEDSLTVAAVCQAL